MGYNLSSDFESKDKIGWQWRRDGIRENDKIHNEKGTKINIKINSISNICSQ